MTLRRNIGIDFGTSSTVLCYVDYELPDGASEPRFASHEADPIKLVRLDDDAPEGFMESVIYEPAGRLDNEGKQLRFFGHVARERAATDRMSGAPGALISGFKMDLLEPGKEADALVRMVQLFKHLRKICDDLPTMRRPVEQTYVSYPAKWPEQLRDATKLAAEEAGFPDVKGADEPCAAMQFFLYFEHQAFTALKKQGLIASGQELKILLIDSGAGTTDFVLYSTKLDEQGGHKVVSTWPDPSLGSNNLGGRDVDRLLVQHLQTYFETYRENPQREIDPEIFRQRLHDIVRFKERILSRYLEDENEKVTRVPYKDAIEDDRHILLANAPPYEFDRDVFGDLARDHLRLFADLTNGAVEDAKAKGLIRDAAEIDFVVLTGGHSKWYFFIEMLQGKWVQGQASEIDLPKIRADPGRCLTYGDPRTIVARGLVLTNLGKVISTKASKSLWCRVLVEVGESEKTYIIPLAQKGEELTGDKTTNKFVALPYERPLGEKIELRVELVSGNTLESGQASPLNVISSNLSPAAKMADALLKRLGYGRVAQTLELYIEVNLDQHGNIAYRGAVKLGAFSTPSLFQAFTTPWFFFQSSNEPLSPKQEETLKSELERQRHGTSL
jgi:Hsp70 protein